MANFTVVIDPGHGGTQEIGDSSANNAVSFSGVMEKFMTLQMGLLVRDALKTVAVNRGHNVKIVMTRETDKNLGLGARANVARDNTADRFLSIHYNGFNKKARGVETWIRPKADGNVNHTEDKKFATNIQAGVFNTIKAVDPQTKNRGVKEQKLGVLNDISLGNTAGGTCRACLVEIEFIDVEGVDKLLNLDPNAPTVRGQIADAIARAIIHDLENP
jgi:N-acetylmuramoyl-L-alanine amidase